MKEELMDMLVRMEQAVATAAPAVWGAAVRQASVDAHLAAGWAVFWAIFFCLRIALSGWMARRAVAEDDEGLLAIATFPGGLGIGALVIAISNAMSAYERSVNPEWRAMKLLAEMIQ